ncbi:MAG: PAS domain S-box protein [Dehalococcoidia bacterium]
MVKERREKELPEGKPRGRGKHSSSTRNQHNVPHSRAHSPSIQPVDWEERYRALFDRSLQYICIHDFEGNILDVNEVALKLLGYNKEDIPHLNIASLLSEDQLPKASAALQKLKDTGMTKQVNEWRLRRKDGSFVDMLLSGALIYREGKPHAVLGIGINITERKQAEIKYKNIIETAIDGFWIMDVRSRFLDVNDSYCRMTGYTREELLKMGVPDVEAVEKPEETAEHIKRVIEQGYDRFETRHRRKDGKIIELEISAMYSEARDGQFVVFIRDVTEHKQAEESLRLSEQNFRDSIEKSPLGIRIVTADGNTLYVNKTLLDICGYSSLEELKAVPRNQLYTPESYAEHRGRVNKRKRREHVPSDYEISIVRKDGQVRRLSVSRGEVMWDGEKQSQVVYQDITEHKRTEEALEKSEERYRQLAENAGEAIFVVQDGIIKFANPKGAQLSGYLLDELVSSPVVKFIHPNDGDMVMDRYTRRLEGEAVPQIYDFRIIRKDGDIRWSELNAVPILWEDRPAVLCFMSDITERKQAEEALQESEERYRALFDRSLDCVFVHDFEGDFLDANEAALKLLGYDREDIPHLNFAALLSQDQLPTTLATLQEFKDTGAQKHVDEFRLRCKDGSFVDMEVIGAVIYHEGKPYAIQGVGRDITERKRAEEALRHSEERYRTILEEMEEGYYEVDIAGNFTFVNDAMSHILGYSRDELIGMNYKAYTPEESIKPIFQAYNRVYRTGEPLKWFPMPEIRKDGTRLLVEDSVLPMRNDKGEVIGFRGVSRDVTERKKAEEALRESEERYRAILERMEDSYFEVDLGGHLTFVNSAACRQLGYSGEELLGMSYKGFTDEGHIKSVFRIYNEIYRTGVPNKGFPWKIIRKDGSPGFIDASVAPLRNGKGEIIGFSGVGRDITERKKIEDQLILTDRLASIGQLAAGIAHELNNPLTAVIGFSDLLLGKDLPADAKEDLKTINQESKRATNIVKGLLAFAREQRTGKLLVDINSIIQGVLQLRSYEQRVSNIEVATRFDPAAPQVMGNGAQLQQVFINIIINAEQAMLEAHRKGKLTIVTERVGDIVRASFTDDGPGISPDNMKQLFTPFFTTREVGKGTGLGLSICHGIVTEHGGKVYAESELGEGATFVVELPISK